jgi:uncharacterized protein (TIGR00369 family)
MFVKWHFLYYTDKQLEIQAQGAGAVFRPKSFMDELRDNQKCYVCGKQNPAGLGVDFDIDAKNRSIRATFTPSSTHQGFEGYVHGGILLTLLDEAMAKLAFSLGIPSLTAEMTTRFRSPASPGEELLVSGKLVEETKKLIKAEAKIQRGAVVIAEATGKLLKIAKSVQSS